MKKKQFKNAIRSLHLWIGLLTGSIVFIVCITGSIYTFKKEIRLAVFPYYSVQKTAAFPRKLPLENIVETYREFSDKTILRLYDFTEEDRSTILLTQKDKEYYFSFLDPYRGKVLREEALSSDFFMVLLRLHRNLLLGNIGRQIVGWSVVIFILSLLTGLILWFPKNKKVLQTKKGRRSKFTVAVKATSKKLVFDLHSVLGFYAASILFILAITGIAWTFPPVDKALYRLVTFEEKKPKKPMQIAPASLSKKSLDSLRNQMNYRQENRKLFLYYLPQKESKPLKVVAYPNDDSFGSSDTYYAHPNTGSLLKTRLDREKNAGEKFRSLYYDIHTGSLLGFWGKLLVFLSGLIGASLPVTGVMLWLNRRKKRKKR